ncbi:hypothetical protein, partial [Lactiplantibacillus plantarum]|uniref:hypothetical protein n=1 Tax=Lactiplantibacillus plantarum TaxID=1590 RepID=UPI0011015A7E
LKEADLFCPNSVRINFTIYLIIGIGLGYTRTTTMGYVGCGLAIVVGLLLQPKISKWYLGLLRNKRQH